MRVNQTGSSSVQGTQTQTTNKTEKASRAYQSKDGAKAREAEKPSSSDSSASAEISSKAKEMSAAKQIASEAPDVREEKIAELRRRIQNKEYNVKPEDIADRMVTEHMHGLG